MNYLKSILAIALIGFFFSCKEEKVDVVKSNEYKKADLVGYWKITKTRAAGDSEDTPVLDFAKDWDYHFTETDSIFISSDSVLLSGTWEFQNNNTEIKLTYVMDNSQIKEENSDDPAIEEIPDITYDVDEKEILLLENETLRLKCLNKDVGHEVEFEKKEMDDLTS